MVSRVLATLLGVGVAACTTIVPEDFEVIHCEQEGVYGPPACDAGQQCIDGDCQIADAPATCCSSSECPENQICSDLPGSSETARSCVDAVLLGHAPPGDGAVGEPCFEAADCRSGSCQAERCVDTCCGSADCPGPCVEGVCRP